MRGFKLQYLFIFGIITACSSSVYTSYESENIGLDSTYNSVELESFIAPYRDEVNAKMDAVIGHSTIDLQSFKPESPLGNFAADCVFDAGNLMQPQGFEDKSETNSIGLLNFGGLRAPINAGKITIGNIYELMPFDNTLTIVKLDSLGIIEMLNYLFDSGGQPVANGRFQLSSAEKVAQIHGEPINFSKPVYVYTSDYLADGGDKMNFLKNAKVKWNSGVLLREIFISAISRKKTLTDQQIEGRVQLEL